MVRTDQSSGRKSHAVFALGAGMFGVSGLANISGPPMSGARAKEPGVVTPTVLPGLLAPCMGGRKRERGDAVCVPLLWVPLPDMRRLLGEEFAGGGIRWFSEPGSESRGTQ